LLKTKLLKTLEHLREAFISNLYGQDPEHTNIRVNSIYYISRVPLEDNARDILNKALEYDTDLYTENAILFALVRLGDRESERHLYRSLTENEEASAINRGLHQVYFGDWVPRAELPPYIDKGEREWYRTLSGMMSHIESDEKRFINSKRLDIYIIRSFIQSRKQLGPLTQEHLHCMQIAVERLNKSRFVEPKYLEDIKHELSLLEALVHQLFEGIKPS
jgi:hypothetical protein